MQTGMTLTVAGPAGHRIPRARTVLVLATIAALTVGGIAIAGGDAATQDPDLVRLIRFMAALKGGFALVALAGCFWRLARPAQSWRRFVYVAGPPLMTAGALGLWGLHDPGLFALSLHLGLFAVLAASLTDRDFVPDLPSRRHPCRKAKPGRPLGRGVPRLPGSDR